MNFFNKKVTIEEETITEEEPEKELEEEEEKEEEEGCEANDCKIDNCEDDDIQWISCDVCPSWWHLFCLDLNTTLRKFTCPKCCLNCEIKIFFSTFLLYSLLCFIVYSTCNLENK